MEAKNWKHQQQDINKHEIPLHAILKSQKRLGITLLEAEKDGFVSIQEALKLHETDTNIIHLSWRFSFTACPDSIYSSQVLILKLSRIDSVLSYELRKAAWSLKRTRGTSGIRVSICLLLPCS
ncbi:hypothetical protein NC652_008840 [Populus alba x Populus x berolinensis]|nr:hypothetical protein NC652_008840 [Populus alba x Populus x berolinensis]